MENDKSLFEIYFDKYNDLFDFINKRDSFLLGEFLDQRAKKTISPEGEPLCQMNYQ